MTRTTDYIYNTTLYSNKLNLAAVRQTFIVQHHFTYKKKLNCTERHNLAF